MAVVVNTTEEVLPSAVHSLAANVPLSAVKFDEDALFPVNIIFAIFTLIFTDYGVPLSVGGRYMTLPLFLYREVIGLLDFSKGTFIGMFLLIPALISFLIDIVVKDKSNMNFINKRYTIKNIGISHFVLKIFTHIIIIFLFILFGSFLYLCIIKRYPYNTSLSLNHFKYVLDRGIISVMFNSLIIAVCTSIVGTIIAYTSAYFVNRMEIKFKKIIHIMIIITLAIISIISINSAEALLGSRADNYSLKQLIWYILGFIILIICSPSPYCIILSSFP